VRGSLVFQIAGAQDQFQADDPVKPVGTGQNMDELIGRLASKAGIDSAVAEKTIGIVLGFLRNEGPSDKVQALIDQIPGAEAAIAASSSNGELFRFGRDKIGADQMGEIISGTPGLNQFA
jgi:hypothetical protein